jgi:hypothetical protein
MINPYVDERRVHFGFSLGINLMSYYVKDSQDTINGEVYHARVSSLMPGFSVGFITDVRLTRHLSLRLCPALHFGQKTLRYKNESGNPIRGVDDSFKDKAELISLPVSIPLYLKWAAERHNNYRPYLIGGGGVQFDFGGQKERPLLQRKFDYFVEFGFGCDFYTRWFKFCPEIKYQVGFANMITPVNERTELPVQNEFYTRALKRLTNQMLTLTFNFE